MASSSHEKAKKTQGIRIDSSLISTASSGDIQDGLEGLGVSVFDQGTFEEGVMKQLDEEVSRRAAEQQKKFLVNEYSRVTQERSTLRRELELLSKKIAGLLSRPLCDVVLTLREMKSTQEQKRKEMIQLNMKEQELLKKLSGQEENKGVASEEGVVNDAAFTIPSMSSWRSEQQKLIETGHMTPFGTSDQSSTGSQTTTRAAVDGLQESNDITTASGDNRSGLRLCSEGFDGLFEDQSTSLVRKSLTKKKSLELTLTKKKKGKEKKRPMSSGAGEGVSVSGEGGEEDGDVWMPTRDEVEQLEREMAEESGRVGGDEMEGGDKDDDDGSTEYTTDEELGADHVLGRVTAKKKRRALSSGESCEEEGDDGRWGRRKRRRKRKLSQANHHLDDGDEEVYRLRMSECDSTDGPSVSDKLIDGRLRVPGSVWSCLYGYQQTGVRWLWELHCQQAGGVVGDEMGLGKTIEMIAFLAALKVSKLRSNVTRELGLGPVLIVCPATIMHQWVSEFHTWWPQFRVAVLHDTGTYHSGPKSALIEDIVQCDGVLVTTYAGVRIYRDHLLPPKWDYVILDEGHKIRNPDTEVTLVCKQFSTPHRIILSGSPMQNNLRELWSLFDFVFPGKLGTLPVFMEQFSVPITLGGYSNATQVQVQTAYRCACILRDTINPYLLRRLKADVKIQLPSKNEQVLFCKMTDYQQELYEEYVTGPDVAAMMVGRKKIFTGLTVLRKLCNHPDLVTNDYREFVTYGKGEEGEGEEDGEDSLFIRSKSTTYQRRRSLRRRRTSTQSSETDEGREGAGLTGYCEEQYGWGKRSGKMIVVEALLKMWFEQNHRVLLFSQSKMLLNILELMIQARGYTYVRMDGDTPIKARQPLIRRFNETPSIFVFLLTTRVGGLGVNLTGADRVIIYDPDWNPSTDTQAQERAWRIGQKRQVTIYRLLTSGTIEEKIYHRQIFKQFLSNRVLKDPKQRRFFKANDLYELFSLGQVRPKGETETSAIFAGTGSDVIPKKLKRRRSHDQVNGLHKSHSKSCDSSCDPQSQESRGKKRRDLEKSKSFGLENIVEERGDGEGEERESISIEDDGTKVMAGESDRAGDAGSVERKEDDGRRVVDSEASELEVHVVNENLSSDVLRHSGSSRGGEDLTSLPHTLQPSSPSVTDIPPPASSTAVTSNTSMVNTPQTTAAVHHKEERERNDISSDTLNQQDNVSVTHTNLLEDNKKKEKKKKRSEDKSEHRHKKKKKRKKKSSAVVEGVEIAGIDKTGLYAGGEGEGGSQRTSSHDDYILTKLFKKSGVHSAIQHDSIMSSASSDYVMIETEAKKVAQSAARALRESRRRCLGGGRGRGSDGGGGGWGHLTWTGQHGSAGGNGFRTQPRFGAKMQLPNTKETNQGSSKLFSGQKAGTSLLVSNQEGSSQVSSSSLLTTMRSRNAHLPNYAVKDIHKSAHDNLMREIRDFIATRCKFDGQATTEELLKHFSSKLPNSDTATFRSMLQEICDFSRIHGEGRWILKAQFR